MPEELKERPIMFSGEMVRAILEGRKTQTRRVVKPQPNNISWHPVQLNRYDGWQDEHGKSYPCPYGQASDLLWVREAWGVQHCFDGIPPRFIIQQAQKLKKEIHIRYAIDKKSEGLPSRPSIHMPRWASRLTLEITGVRVERLQEISEEDCVAEGMQKSFGGMWCGAPHKLHGFPRQHNTAREAFADIWNSIYSDRKHGWDTNPWVWVIEFRPYTFSESAAMEILL